MVPHRKPVDEWKPWPLLTQEQIEESPSFKLGMSFKAERRLRETACIIIWLAGKALDQGIVSIATAQMYLMRFFACKPYQHNDNFIVAVAALFVASKTENKPRPLHQIAHACWRERLIIWAAEQKKKHKDKPPGYWEQLQVQEERRYRDAAWYKRFAEAITTAERVLLYTTGFQFNVNTGFYALLGCKAHLSKHEDLTVKTFFEDLNLQLVWNIVIECYKKTRLCLQYDPRTIGIACYEMTCTQLSKEIPLVEGESWWRYVAKLQDWPLEVGDPATVKEVQTALMKVFKSNQPVQPKANLPSGQATPEMGSQPGTPLLQNGSQTPNLSPLPALTSAMPSTSGHVAEGQQNGTAAGEQINGRPSPPLPGGLPPLPAKSPSVAGPKILQQTPTPQVKQKQDLQGVHFSPSDEFSASPKKLAEYLMVAPDLLEPLGARGDLGFEQPQKVTDEGLQRARLEKAKALGGGLKRKAEVQAEKEPPIKLQHGSPDGNFGVEFEP